MSFSRMNQVLRLDVDDHVVVVQPGITLIELAEALAPSGLRYPVFPGELSGSLGGNVNTNAGGMRAVRHGVTRQHVLGLELVLIDGTVVRTGAPVMKSSSGYDLTQLVVGSEGTLALVTEITLRLSPTMAHSATILVPFSALNDVTRIVPSIVASGLEPSILEYADAPTMIGMTQAASFELGVNAAVASKTAAYLLIVLETRTAEQLEERPRQLAALVESGGALDLFVLPDHAAPRLIKARENLFWVSKAAGANEIIDVVVPRSTVPVSFRRSLSAWPSVMVPSYSVAGTSATATCTFPSSRTTTNGAPHSCTNSSPSVSDWADRFPANTESDSTSRHRTSRSRIPILLELQRNIKASSIPSSCSIPTACSTRGRCHERRPRTAPDAHAPTA
jgi:FAD/FMN-containing dehydrogenase